MKKTIASVLGLLCAASVFAGEIDSEVIHDYSLIQLNYNYFHDTGNTGVDAHGLGAKFGYDYKNFLFLAEGGYGWADDGLGLGADANFWAISGSVGYVVRLFENRINLIPLFGVAYSELTIDAPAPFGKFKADETSIHPGVIASYAFNNCWSAHVGYSYDYGLDSEDGTHSMFLGTTVALSERIGATVRSAFSDGEGFAGIVFGVAYHY